MTHRRLSSGGKRAGWSLGRDMNLLAAAAVRCDAVSHITRPLRAEKGEGRACTVRVYTDACSSAIENADRNLTLLPAAALFTPPLLSPASSLRLSTLYFFILHFSVYLSRRPLPFISSFSLLIQQATRTGFAVSSHRHHPAPY